jgi:cytochrome c1
MQGMRRFLSRLITLFRADRAEAELTREIASHLQLLEDQFTAKGMTPEEAKALVVYMKQLREPAK